MSDLVLQFSSSAPRWRWYTPKFVIGKRGRLFPCNVLFDKYWATPVIRMLSHSPFTHCDIRLPDGSLLGASDNPHAPVIRGNPRGVAIRPADYQPFLYRNRMVLRTDRVHDIIAIAETQIGKKFDNSGLKDFMSQGFPHARDWRLRDSWWCSELVTWAMEAGGFWQPKELMWPKSRVSPTDLLLVCLMDERWVNRETFWIPIKD